MMMSPSEEDAWGTAQPPSAQTMEELADSFSEQLLIGDTETQETMHGGIEKQASNNSTIFSPKQAGLPRSYSEMLADEEEDMVKYRRYWKEVWAAHLVPSKTTIFSIQVMENEVWRIRWPVEVYGFIAARDSVDHNRNLLFNRTRDDPQILSQQDPFLQLTGPCRPILLMDPVDFEMQLKVKGTTESEDETLVAHRFVYGHGFGASGDLACRRWDGGFCTLEITSALLGCAVAATIISADVIQGSWPDNFGGRVVSRTAGIDEEFVLLDSGDGPMHVDSDGHIILQRCVVCVQRDEILTVSVEACSKDGISAAARVEFRPKDSLTSIGTCNLGFCTVQFIVGWSLTTTKFDLLYDGN